MSDFEPIFIAACDALQHQASHADAEAFLQAARENIESISACRAILCNDSIQPSVRLHALLVYRDATARCWNGLSAEEKATQREWLLPFSISLCEKPQTATKLLLNQLSGVIAAIWKRSWLDITHDDKFALLGHLLNVMREEAINDTQLFVARTCVYLIQEFSLLSGSRSTALNVTAEFHRKVAKEFQANGLRETLQIASERLIREAGTLLDGPNQLEIVALLLEVVNEVLNWDFSNDKRADAVSGASLSANTRIVPPSTFAGILLDTNFTQAVCNVYTSVRQQAFHNDAALQCTKAARLVAGQLSALYGPVLEQTSDSAQQHISTMLYFFSNLISSSLVDCIQQQLSGGVLVDEVYEIAYAEVHDVAMSLSSLVFNHKLANLSQIFNMSSLLTSASELVSRILTSVAELSGHIDHALAERTEGVARHLQAFLSCSYSHVSIGVDALLGLWRDVANELRDLSQQEMCASSGVNISTLGEADAALVPLLAPLRECISSVYQKVVLSRISLAKAIIRCDIDDDNPFEDSSLLEEHFAAVASLGRFYPYPTLELLNKLGNEGLNSLEAAITTSNTAAGAEGELAVASEEMWWICSYLGTLLADHSKGETPTIPSSLNMLSKALCKYATGSVAAPRDVVGATDPVVQAIELIFRVVFFEHSRVVAVACNTERLSISPYLATRLLWCLNRIVATYVAPDLYLYKSSLLSFTLSNTFGWDTTEVESALANGTATTQPNGLLSVPTAIGVNSAREVVEMATQVGACWLGTWGRTEAGVAEQALGLLHTLCTAPTIGRVLSFSPSFSSLVMAWSKAMQGDGFTPSDDEGWKFGLTRLHELSYGAQTKLMASLLSLTRHIANEVVGYLDRLEAPMSDIETMEHDEVIARWRSYYYGMIQLLHDRFMQVVNSAEYQASSSNTDVQRELERLLFLFCGVIEAQPRLPSSWHSEVSLTVADLAVSHIMPKYSAAGSVCTAILQLIKQFVSSDLFMLSEEHSARLFGVVSNLFTTYSTCHGTSFGRLKEGSLAELESLDDIKTLIQILQQVISQEDLSFFADTPSDDTVKAVGECVVRGLGYLMPLMTSGLLEYQELSTAYATLISDLIASHAEQVAQLDAEIFSSFAQSLEFGVSHSVPSICISALEAIGALAQHHATCAARGLAGLSVQLAANPHLFSSFTHSIFIAVLGSSAVAREILYPAADALLALLVAQPDAFKTAVEHLMSVQTAENAARFWEEIGTLTSAYGVAISTDRANQHKFRANFEMFVDAVRSFTRVH